MHSEELRKKFREFFVSRNHMELPSESLIPDKNDPTVLLTTAGMQPLVPFLMGAPHPKGDRLFDTQKCFRTPDIEDVGDDTHHTFFEMLGNWSLGNYFKEEAIELAYDFFVDVLGLDPKKFAITIFAGDEDAPRDDEAEKIWLSKGLTKEQIFEFDKKDNFWGPAGKTGPCGPCSEIHYDRGEQYGADVGPNSDENQRYVEIWNLVFMEYNKKEDGTYEKLSQKNVDTGVGFERLLSILNQKDSAYDTDLFADILNKIEELSGKKYQNNIKSFRVIADHLRGSTFLIADGVSPGNTSRDYVLRRIFRRAVMYGNRKLGIKGGFAKKIAEVVINYYKNYYPELEKRDTHIFNTMDIEEENFLQTMERGEKILADALEKENKITGKKAFELYDTYGFPFELTEEIAEENSMKVNKEEFQKELEAQRERSRAKSTNMFERKEDLIEFENLPATDFLRNTSETEAKVLAIQKSTNNEDIYFVALDKTPFYAESGGQVADTGSIDGFLVLDVQKNKNNVFIHTIKADNPFKQGDTVKAIIDAIRRAQIRRHHSLAHLLHASLRKVLGEHVEQAGSEVSETRTRFDFSHPKNLSKEEIRKTEDLISSWVAEGIEGVREELPIEEAQKKGAMALFSDKFDKGQTVRVISFGEVSKELCGGTHIKNTAEIGAIKIISESSVASGIRRIEAVCSLEAQKLLQEQYLRLEELANKLKTPVDKIEERIETLAKEKKSAEEETKEIKKTIINFEAENILTENQGEKIIIRESENPVELAKALNGKAEIVILFGKQGSVAISTKSVSAKELLQKLNKEFGGGGGGSDNFASGGGLQGLSVEKIKAIIS